MSQPTRFFITCKASCLLLSVGGRAALAQTPNSDTVRLILLPRAEYGNDSQWLDQRSLWLDQQQQWFKQLEQDNLLREIPTTSISYRSVGGAGQGGGGRVMGNLECKVCTLWDAMPIWLPYVESSFRGGGITELGELDLFMPLMWSDNALLFADLRGSIGDTGHHEGNWSVVAAGAGSVVVVDGSAGIISEGDTTVLSSGQVVMGGGGSTLNVVGRNIGGTISGNTASGNFANGFRIAFSGNIGSFSSNSSTNNTLEGYNIGFFSPSEGVGTNTGFGNGGGNDNF